MPVVLLLAQLVFIHLGQRYRRLAHDLASNAAVAPIVSTVLSLMGLVLAFSFANAATRLDANRKSILEEAIAIEGAWKLIDVAEPDVRPQMSHLLRRYVDARIRAYETYEERVGIAEYDRELQVSAALFEQLWSVGSKGPTTPSGEG